MNILIVDDFQYCRDSMKHLLREQVGLNGSTKIDEAVNGCDALKMVREKNYDLIITEIMMPCMNGVKLISKLIKEFRFSAKKIMIFSAKTNSIGVKIALKTLGISVKKSYIDKMSGMEFAPIMLHRRIDELGLSSAFESKKRECAFC